MTEQLSPPLHRQLLDADPFQQFRHWLSDAEQAGIELANAMTLATADRDGKPAARIVLLRGIDQRGFAFFSNYHSRKGQQLSENPFAALVFFWPELARQVRIEGAVELLSPASRIITLPAGPGAISSKPMPPRKVRALPIGNI